MSPSRPRDAGGFSLSSRADVEEPDVLGAPEGEGDRESDEEITPLEPNSLLASAVRKDASLAQSAIVEPDLQDLFGVIAIECLDGDRVPMVRDGRAVEILVRSLERPADRLRSARAGDLVQLQPRGVASKFDDRVPIRASVGYGVVDWFDGVIGVIERLPPVLEPCRLRELQDAVRQLTVDRDAQECCGDPP